MRLQYLLVEYIEQIDKSTKERYSLAIGNDERMRFVCIKDEDWFDMLKEFTRDKLIIGQNKKQTTKEITRIIYFIKNLDNDTSI